MRSRTARIEEDYEKMCLLVCSGCAHIHPASIVRCDIGLGLTIIQFVGRRGGEDDDSKHLEG